MSYNICNFLGQPGTPGLPGSPSYPKPSYPVAPGNMQQAFFF